MRRLATSSALALVLVLTLGPPGPTSSGAPPTPAADAVAAERFVAMPCPERAFPRFVDVDCGYIKVPEDRSRPRGRTIRVAAAIVHSRSAAPAEGPVLVLPGGPSAGAITPFYFANYFRKSTWARDHDLVFVDTRGTGLSTPRLGCPEVDRAFVPFFYNRPYAFGRGLRIVGGALEQCRHRLVRQGIRPDAYTTRASVADLEALRGALEVDRWNLLSISADGILGLSYMRERPKHPRQRRRLRPEPTDAGRARLRARAGADTGRALRRRDPRRCWRRCRGSTR